MAVYLLSSEESVLSSNSSLERISFGVLASRAMHMVPAYEVISLQEEAVLHNEITRKLMKQHQAVEELIA
jgi:hypothetical protein